MNGSEGVADIERVAAGLRVDLESTVFGGIDEPWLSILNGTLMLDNSTLFTRGC